MSMGAKNRSKEKRKKEKKRRKEQKAALYASFKEQGRNKKSKRFLLSTEKTNKASATKHPISPCGNPGCKACYGVSYTGFLDKDGNPKDMRQWMYISWVREGGPQKRKAIQHASGHS
jgi:hypothetical protein